LTFAVHIALSSTSAAIIENASDTILA